MLENWWNAAISSGMKPTGDPNAGRTTGVTYFPTVSDFTTRTRSHARLNHYERVKERRPNYHILAEHTVSRVIFEGKKAVGVMYLPSAGGDVAIASAKKEVLLAAGAVHTPQILQLSGIGPREVLEEVGIEVVADLPGVGQNFHDQPSIIIPYEGKRWVIWCHPAFQPHPALYLLLSSTQCQTISNPMLVH